ncbi:hypothetical protein CDL12_01843 [Handroanthus impetiginosus]|uniref:Uncharacterized protein n=1 Tax=Handroanthus impetiginosus TaxID=429701 RepID=A0A2G9I6P4_9LAMI|nr:hypothetical protein CDL12_01843 [Handroanthus impetiginosus]
MASSPISRSFFSAQQNELSDFSENSKQEIQSLGSSFLNFIDLIVGPFSSFILYCLILYLFLTPYKIFILNSNSPQMSKLK